MKKITQIKKVLLTTTMASAMVLMASPSQAETGTINFTGKIVDSTCDVQNDGLNQTVSLPKVKASRFTNQGDTAGRTNFKIALSNCNAALTSSELLFEGYTRPNNIEQSLSGAVGSLKNTATTNKAAGLGIQLLDADNSYAVINLADTTNAGNLLSKNISGSSVTFNLAAEYLARDADTANKTGNVASSVGVEVRYR